MNQQGQRGRGGSGGQWNNPHIPTDAGPLGRRAQNRQKKRGKRDEESAAPTMTAPISFLTSVGAAARASETQHRQKIRKSSSSSTDEPLQRQKVRRGSGSSTTTTATNSAFFNAESVNTVTPLRNNTNNLAPATTSASTRNNNNTASPHRDNNSTMTPTSTVTPHRVNSSIVASASAMILHKDNNSTMAPTDTATPHKDNNTATLHKDNDNVAPANRVSGSSVLNTTTASLDARSIDTGTPHRNNDIKSNAVAPTSTNVNNFASATARNTPFHTLITDPARKSNNNASTTQNIPNSVDVSTLAVNDRATLRIFIMKKALFAATSEDHTFTTPDGVIRDFNPDMSLDRIEKLVEEESEVDEAVLKAMGHGGVRGK